MLKATAKNPSQRYQSMEEFDEDLRLLEAGQGELIKSFVLPPDQRDRGRWAILSCFMLALFVFVLCFSVSDRGLLTQAHFELINVSDPGKFMHWLEVSDKLESRGKSTTAELLRAEIAASLANNKSKAIDSYLDFAGTELASSRFELASYWSLKALTELSKMSRKQTFDQKEKPEAVSIERAAGILLRSHRLFTKAQLKVFIDIQRINSHVLLLQLHRLICVASRQIHAKPDDDLLRPLLDYGKILAGEAEYKELKKDTPYILEIDEKIHGKNSAVASEWLAYMSSTVLGKGNSQLARELADLCSDKLKACSTKGAGNCFLALYALARSYCRLGKYDLPNRN